MLMITTMMMTTEQKEQETIVKKCEPHNEVRQPIDDVKQRQYAHCEGSSRSNTPMMTGIHWLLEPPLGNHLKLHEFHFELARFISW